MKIMRDSLFIRFLVCPLLIFNALIFGPGFAIIKRELTIEDCQEWVDEKSELPNQVAHVEKRVFNCIYDGFIFLFFWTICLVSFVELIQYNWLYILPITIFLWLLYYPIMEYKTGKTMAKFITQTRVVSIDNTKINADQVFKRSLYRLIPFEGFSFLKIYPIGWHDLFSKTKVVNDSVIPEAVKWMDEIPADFGL